MRSGVTGPTGSGTSEKQLTRNPFRLPVNGKSPPPHRWFQQPVLFRSYNTFRLFVLSFSLENGTLVHFYPFPYSTYSTSRSLLDLVHMDGVSYTSWISPRCVPWYQFPDLIPVTLPHLPQCVHPVCLPFSQIFWQSKREGGNHGEKFVRRGFSPSRVRYLNSCYKRIPLSLEEDKLRSFIWDSV